MPNPSDPSTNSAVGALRLTGSLPAYKRGHINRKQGTAIALCVVIPLMCVWLYFEDDRSPQALLSDRPCAPGKANAFPFCNSTLPRSVRLADLVDRLTINEKRLMLDTRIVSVGRLGLPRYELWSEALHGLSTSPGVSFTSPDGELTATAFPQVIATAAAWNPALWGTVASVISTEARAFNNIGQAGLTFFAPSVNIFRDPRWGRGQDTAGEDPFLSSVYAREFVRGMQFGSDPRFHKTAATCKQFLGYNLENTNPADPAAGIDRFHFNAVLTAQDLADTFEPPFRACVTEGHALGIQCAQNSINGVPACANAPLLTGKLRNEWNFTGFVVSSCGIDGSTSQDKGYDAILGIADAHQYVSNLTAAASVALLAGCDVDCGRTYDEELGNALRLGYVAPRDIDVAVARVLSTLFAVGWFDPVSAQPYCKIPSTIVNSIGHQESALIAARESIVLLANTDASTNAAASLLVGESAAPLGAPVLPLTDGPALHQVAVIGPLADNIEALVGNSGGQNSILHPATTMSPLSAFRDSLGESRVAFVRGCSDVACATIAADDMIRPAVSEADAVVVFLGLSNRYEGVGRDRATLTLPGQQERLLEVVRNHTRAPLILVVISGGAVDVSRLLPFVQAVIWMGYPGQAGGTAIVDTIFGRSNPSGRLPITFYPNAYVDQIAMGNMHLRDAPGRTYRFYNGTAVFPFGAGLSYSTFDYAFTKNVTAITVSATDLLAQICGGAGSTTVPAGWVDGTTVTNVSVNVTNRGPLNGSDVLQMYSVAPVAQNPDQQDAFSRLIGVFPRRTLVGFDKVAVDVTASANVDLPLTVDALRLVGKNGGPYVIPGDWTVRVNDKLVFTVHVTSTSTEPIPCS